MSVPQNVWIAIPKSNLKDQICCLWSAVFRSSFPSLSIPLFQDNRGPDDRVPYLVVVMINRISKFCKVIDPLPNLCFMSLLIRILFCSLILLLCIDNRNLYAKNYNVLEVGKFSTARIEEGLPDGWEPLTFKKIPPTRYELVKEKDRVVVKATSSSGASGLIRKITINPSQYPFVQWQWKINNVYSKGDVAKREGDDYPARLYITFAYDPEKVGFFEKTKYEAAQLLYGEYPPIAAINYIWANRAPIGTMVDNPYTFRSKMIAIQSGPGKIGIWQNEQRNIYEDYQTAFGTPPPMISGVAIMTDSDNTGDQTISYFGDIVFKTRTNLQD